MLGLKYRLLAENDNGNASGVIYLFIFLNS